MLLNTTIFLEMCYYFDITQILNRFINKQNYTYKLILYYRRHKMHELSMAQGIINAVIETAESNNATEVNEVTIELGRLAMVNPEQLKFILGVLVENTIVEDAEIHFEDIPVEVECSECGFHGDAILDDKDHYAPMVKCPECDSLAVEILNGRDIVVKNIVIEKPDDD